MHLLIDSFIYRYECPAGCLDAAGKVVGTVYYEMVSTLRRWSPAVLVPRAHIDQRSAKLTAAGVPEQDIKAL